jgi:uroporphyrinogen-III synthase
MLIAQGKEQDLREASIISIGAMTTQTLEELGFPPAATAMKSTLPCLIEALIAAQGTEPR